MTNFSEGALADVVRRVAADVFDVPVSEISMESCPEVIEAWDSLGHLSLVVALEEELDVQILPDDIDRMLSIADVVEVVQKRIA